MKEMIKKFVVMPLAVGCLTTFLSCGHQESKQDGNMYGMSEEESTEAVATSEGEESNELTAENAVAEDSSLTATTESIPSMDVDTALDASTEVSAAPTTEESPVVASADALVTPELTESEPAPMISEDQPLEDTLAETAKEVDAQTAKPAVRSYIPKLPKQVVWKKGATLNRYYFLREGDTPDKVAELIYADSSKSSDLAVWNGGTWGAGRIIMYNSPELSEDTTMKSFYEERSVTTETYTVKKGDWLSTIAMNTYGNIQSWKEIAVVNSLTNPDSLTEGTQLTLYPVNFPAKITPVAANTASEVTPAAVTQDAEMVAEKAVEEVAVPEAKPAPELASANVGTFFEKHYLIILGGFGLLLAGYILRRRGRRTNDMME